MLYRNPARRLLLIVWMLVGLVGPARGALASPSAPAGCIFYVSTTSDGTDADWDLTLREAIMLANGGTGPSGLNRSLTTHEVVYLQLAGSCSFDSNGNVLSGGGGYVDTIRFNNLLGLNPTLTLSSNLPGMNDSVGDVLDGSYTSIYPTINANANNFGLTVGSYNTVRGVRVTGATTHDFNVAGSDNQFIDIAAWKSGGTGMDIRGDNNTVDNALIGIGSTSATSCGAGSANKGNAGAGIIVETYGVFVSAQHNVIKNSLIGCNGTTGVEFMGNGALNNTLGPGNDIGIANDHLGNLANGASGVFIGSGATSNRVVTNTIGYNSLAGVWTDGSSALISQNTITANNTSGVYVSGAQSVQVDHNTIAENVENGVYISGAGTNHVGDNTITGNAYNGVLIDGASSANTIGGPTLSSALGGNLISGNSRHGIYLLGTGVNTTIVLNNKVGSNANETLPYANGLNGITLDGAQGSFIGDVNEGNHVGGNLLNGIALLNGARNNTLAYNDVGALPNNLSGVLIDSNAHDNTLSHMTVHASGGSGVLIRGSSTATNTVTDSTLSNNGAYGVLLRDGAWNNLITQTSLLNNHFDGIGEWNGTYNNVWSHITSLYNSGLIVDTNITDTNANITEQPYPVITHISTVNATTFVVTGTAGATSGFTSVKVELYGGLQPGQAVYLGAASTDASGAWSYKVTGVQYSARLCLAAFQTATTNFFGITRVSSEFGPPTCHYAFVPAVTR